MENLLSQNVRRICKEQKIQLKELADTIQKIATALGVSMKSLFEPLDDVVGFIRIRGKAYQFNSRTELDRLLFDGGEDKKTEVEHKSTSLTL